MSFGEQLKTRREALHLSRSALAEKLGISVSAIGNYETGISFPKEEVLLRLFDALQTDPNRLFRDSYCPHSFELSNEERALIEQCRTLSPTGRQTVYTVAGALCTELIHEYEEEYEPRLIPLYNSPDAAGYAAPVPNEDFTYIPADNTVPRGADFAVRIRDNSMTPYIADGSIVYVNRDPLTDGDVGIFCVDGAMLCKQYHRDVGGAVHLFSLNRSCADADLVLPASGRRSFTCFGRVMLSQHVSVPGI